VSFSVPPLPPNVSGQQWSSGKTVILCSVYVYERWTSPSPSWCPHIDEGLTLVSPLFFLSFLVLLRLFLPWRELRGLVMIEPFFLRLRVLLIIFGFIPFPPFCRIDGFLPQLSQAIPSLSCRVGVRMYPDLLSFSSESRGHLFFPNLPQTGISAPSWATSPPTSIAHLEWDVPNRVPPLEHNRP